MSGNFSILYVLGPSSWIFRKISTRYALRRVSQAHSSTCFSQHLVFLYLPLLLIFSTSVFFFFCFTSSLFAGRVCVCHFYSICEIARNSAPTFVYDFSNKWKRCKKKAENMAYYKGGREGGRGSLTIILLLWECQDLLPACVCVYFY